MALTAEFPRGVPRAVWLAARARNAARRPIFIGAVATATIALAAVALLVAPQQVKDTSSPTLGEIGERPDTGALLAALAQANERLATAEASLAQAKVRVQSIPAQPTDTLSPHLIALRDSLTNSVNDLDALLMRAETAPVAASYRALSESPQLMGNAQVRALVDSITDIERNRATLGPAGQNNPAYTALTAHANDLGATIQKIAQDRRAELRDAIAKLNVPNRQELISDVPAVDTAGWLAERDSARSFVAQATIALQDARAKAKDYDQALRRTNADSAFVTASPAALLGAALVLGIVMGFGIALSDELRSPRVSADEHEVERLTGARVLATIIPRPRNPDRARRSADRLAPPYFDPGADGFQLTYLHVARTGASRLLLTIMGDETGIAAVVGMNLAAIAADEARSTLLVDIDSRTAPVAAALRVHAEPGVADVLQRHAEWSEATSQAPAGRDRFVDVLPSGITTDPLDAARVTELLQGEAARLLRHYEAILIVAPMQEELAAVPGALPITDAVLCARVGHTKIGDLNRGIQRIRAAGGNALGIVLWDALPPALPSPERIARSPRPVRTAEMRAMTSAS